MFLNCNLGKQAKFLLLVEQQQLYTKHWFGQISGVSLASGYGKPHRDFNGSGNDDDDTSIPGPHIPNPHGRPGKVMITEINDSTIIRLRNKQFLLSFAFELFQSYCDDMHCF